VQQNISWDALCASDLSQGWWVKTPGPAPPKCGVGLWRWENQCKLSSFIWSHNCKVQTDIVLVNAITVQALLVHGMLVSLEVWVMSSAINTTSYLQKPNFSSFHTPQKALW